MMTPKFICFDEAGLDEFFIFKHKYEKEVLNIDGHVLYTEFMKQMIDNMKDMTYYDANTKNSIGFNDIEIGEYRYIVHTPADDDTLNTFHEALKSIGYDYSKLHEIDMHKLPEDLDKTSFFNIKKKMLLV